MAINTRRREFIATLGSAAAAWPLVARAQQPKMPVVGFLSTNSPDDPSAVGDAFREGLGQIGYLEGRNVAIELRFAGHRSEQLRAHAADLARRQVNVIYAAGSEAGLAAKAATSTVPIAFFGGSDPVVIGLVGSLDRPGGNVTGATVISHSLGPKRLELIREILPDASRIGILVQRTDPSTDSEVADLKAAASAIGMQTVVFALNGPSEIEAAFTTFAQEHVQAIVNGGGPLLVGLRVRVGDLALRHRLPMMVTMRETAAAGALLSYGASLTDAARQAAVYAGRILRGEKPADLPVMQPTRFGLVINLKTAKALGLDVSPLLLARADDVIE
jgi:putative ABC transport system substrate-binding protein